MAKHKLSKPRQADQTNTQDYPPEDTAEYAKNLKKDIDVIFQGVKDNREAEEKQVIDKLQRKMSKSITNGVSKALVPSKVSMKTSGSR